MRLKLSDLRPEFLRAEIAKRRLQREADLRIANIASQFKGATTIKQPEIKPQ
jgi:hypothetical protein